MLYGKLDIPGTYASLLIHPVWIEALGWLSSIPKDLAPGIHRLRGDLMFANAHAYETKSRELCRYEGHRRYVDLQYCVSGGEIIEWQPLSALTPTDDYDPKRDVIHFSSPNSAAAALHVTRGSFAVFFPSDGHRPKIASPEHDRVSKVVIKIDLCLLGGEPGPSAIGVAC